MARARLRTGCPASGKAAPGRQDTATHRSPHGQLGRAGAERKRCDSGPREAGSPRPRDNLAPMIRRAFRLSVVLVPLALAACATQATPPPTPRSEERRVGNGGVSPCKFRGSQVPQKKKRRKQIKRK